jgi:hypothetical protein
VSLEFPNFSSFQRRELSLSPNVFVDFVVESLPINRRLYDSIVRPTKEQVASTMLNTLP